MQLTITLWGRLRMNFIDWSALQVGGTLSQLRRWKQQEVAALLDHLEVCPLRVRVPATWQTFDMEIERVTDYPAENRVQLLPIFHFPLERDPRVAPEAMRSIASGLRSRLSPISLSFASFGCFLGPAVGGSLSL
jgi:hypothetical protein